MTSSQKCVHKGCGKVYTDPSSEGECVYHPGPPIFHEGQKGWKCCKPRVLTFDEFLSIPPCTTGKHSAVDDTPAPAPAPTPGKQPEAAVLKSTSGESTLTSNNDGPTSSADFVTDKPRVPTPQQQRQQPTAPPAAAAPPPESDSDNPATPIPSGARCRRRGCNAECPNGRRDEQEKCTYHPGHPLFHEGSKGYTCCSRRVLEFDEFMRIEGCQTRERHMYVGSGRKKHTERQDGEEILESVRNDFYQTATEVIVSFYLKKIDPARATVKIVSPLEVELDLPTADKKRYKTTVPLYGLIDPEKSSFKIMGTKLEMSLVKADGSGWPHLRSDERPTGEIIQVGKAARA
ncbi:MAG: hypothetical protein M1816_005025 [Peltula sp. TS41687]|nr:MAG: hypothetical protein M1816_005025 [Peltula sp. TS41687]